MTTGPAVARDDNPFGGERAVRDAIAAAMKRGERGRHELDEFERKGRAVRLRQKFRDAAAGHMPGDQGQAGLGPLDPVDRRDR